VLSFVYFKNVIDPTLHFHFQQTAFLTGKSFLYEFTAYPGGISDYCAIFLAQFFSFPVWGSLIAAFFCVAIAFFIWQTGKKIFSDVQLAVLFISLPFMILVGLQSNYYYPFAITFNLFLIAAATWAYLLYIQKYPKFSVAGFIIFSIALYAIAGGMSFLTFCLNAIFIHWYRCKGAKKIVLPLIIAAYALLIPFVAYKFIYLTSLNTAYLKAWRILPMSLEYTPTYWYWLMFSVLPVLLIMESIVSWSISKFAASKPLYDKKKSTALPTTPKSNSPKIFYLSLSMQLLLLVVLANYIIKKTYDEPLKTILKVEQMADNQEWEKIIYEAEHAVDYERFVNFEYYRALAHTGLLLERAFNYAPVLGSDGLFLNDKMVGEITLPTSDLFYDLGVINTAQHYAYEAQTHYFYSPRALKRLIMVSIINGNLKVAANFTSILERNMLYQNWVSNYKPYLADSALASVNPTIKQKREFILTKDFFAADNESTLSNVVDQQPHNKMACEYLALLYLLEKDLDKLDRITPFLLQLQYKSAPNLIQQAALLFRDMYPQKQNAYLAFVKVSKELQLNFDAFRRKMIELKQQQADEPTAQNALRTNFGNTYWFYYLFFKKPTTKIEEQK